MDGQTTLRDDIKAEACSLGFSLCGITSPAPPIHFPVYEKWLANGLHGTMTYLATERARQCRKNPGLILEDCHSILTCGIRYPAPFEMTGNKSTEPHGRIASYAWGEDYHWVIPPRLDQLIVSLEKIVGKPVDRHAYTDTGPILEREISQSAGLGWIGKNSCLISPTQGSFFFLAEVFLNIEIEPDLPFLADRCGSCTRCITACPTHCIQPDRTLDATRCISYLTIEQKGSISPDLRLLMGNWIFGCDFCQAVCPWNTRFAQLVSDPAFDARPGVPLPELHAELLLSPQEFNRKFRRSPVLRAKRRGYLRNVAIALGNAKETASVPYLTTALRSDAEPLVRAHAAWAMGQIGTQAARLSLENAQKIETDPAVLFEIETARAVI
ncbi:MAG TPA: tRNA epoxyqueuosine(34) reductase QueG [Anaerolineaceae bacterium]|nr:tRNA epoxyqueuosine(34) reductase QueG [Anaerolineaceae bacterium]